MNTDVAALVCDLAGAVVEDTYGAHSTSGVARTGIVAVARHRQSSGSGGQTAGASLSPVEAPIDLAHRLAHVLRSGEESCLVVVDQEPFEATFASFFPTPRRERVLPGHLVAVVADLVVWRWFDAVVVDPQGDQVRLWEAAHGEVLAQARHGEVQYAPGQRAYLSSGLPGADWWVEGCVSRKPMEAVVDVGAAHAFLTEHGLLPASSGKR